MRIPHEAQTLCLPLSVHSLKWAAWSIRRRIQTCIRGGKALCQVRKLFVAGQTNLLTGCTVPSNQWTPPCCAICRRIEVWTTLQESASVCRRTARRLVDAPPFMVARRYRRGAFIVTLGHRGHTAYIQSFPSRCGFDFTPSHSLWYIHSYAYSTQFRRTVYIPRILKLTHRPPLREQKQSVGMFLGLLQLPVFVDALNCVEDLAHGDVSEALCAVLVLP